MLYLEFQNLFAANRIMKEAAGFGPKLDVGVSFHLGLNRKTPRGSVVLQFQFENVLGYQGR